MRRPGLERQIARRFGRSPAAQTGLAVLAIDGFAALRAAIGHRLGGELVAALAHRLSALHPDHWVAQLAEDSIVVTFDASDTGAALQVAQALHNACEAPLALGDHAVDVQAIVGLADPAQGGARAALEQAAIALDQARAGGLRTAMFDPHTYGQPAANLALMSEMRRSISAGDMVLHYQPRLGLRGEGVVGVEALVRWRHPHRGLLAPGLFIGMAEATGHIGALTEWVLEQAIVDQAALLSASHRQAMSVNLAGRLLGDAQFVDIALMMADNARGPLTFEVRAAALLTAPDERLPLMRRLVAGGVKLAIDDYGVGLSSLAALKTLPVAELKIDASLVASGLEAVRDRLVLRSVIDLAHGLGMAAVAEGVEDAAALKLLTGLGCDMAQGFAIARPMPLADLIDYLDGESVARAPGRASTPDSPLATANVIAGA